MLTLKIMQTMWPHGNNKVPGLIEAIAAAAPTVFPKYGLTSDLLIAHAMAQFSHECGAGNDMVENINYTRACVRGLALTLQQRSGLPSQKSGVSPATRISP